MHALMRPFAALGRRFRARSAVRTGEPAHQAGATSRQRGQVLPIFVILSVVLLGGAALVSDVAWWWTNQQRMQRAADAGALAGAIHLPGNQSLAFSTALAETAKNGYPSGIGGVVVTPRRDPGDPRKLIVDIDGPVGTHFARVFCWDGGPCLDHVDASVTGAASFVLPVPMGSPQNYYGVGYLVDAVTTTVVTPTDDDTGFNSTGQADSGQWSNAHLAGSNDNNYTTEDSDGHEHVWRSFGFLSEIPNDPSVSITGLQVRLNDARATGSGASDNCRIRVEVTWNGGADWSTPNDSGVLPTGSDGDFTLGSSSSTNDWGAHSWVRADLSDSNFRVRLTWRNGISGCASSRNVRLDELEARVDFHYDQVTTSTTIEEVDVESPTGNVLAPQNFWGALQSQGAPNVQGDAYTTYYDTRTSHTNSDYNPELYYQYGVEFPAGASQGEIWLFDPGFCHVDSNKGTGENWNTGSAYGYSPHQPVSTFYDLYDTRNTPYNYADDVLVSSSGDAFKRLYLRDSQLDTGSPLSADDCKDLEWHNGWWKLADDLSGSKTYRLHTYSTDPASETDQRNSTALNAFAIWSRASNGTPRVYGLGAMEAYIRLPGGRSSEFYLAQIDAEHAGKTMVIKLWDPGDTGNLAANLEILAPSDAAYQATNFSYTAAPNSHHPATSSCGSRSGTGVSSVTTNTGGTSLYNGCWLTIEIVLPTDYSAPHPATDTVTDEGGWWKIRYNMSGSTSDNSTDLTTWEVELRGNPVHLVLE